MKSLLATIPVCVFLALAQACADGGTVNRRGEVAATIALPPVQGPSDGDIAGDPNKSLDYIAPSIIEAKNNAALAQEFKDNIGLISKVSATEIVLFGKNGKSWVYNPAVDAVPNLLEAPIVLLEGYGLYTLPQGKFWLVGPQTLGRRKASDVVTGAIPVENFNTASIKGDWTKVRVIYAAADTIILQLDTQIAILAIRGGVPSVTQFSSNLPVPLNGAIVAVGETEAGGFWFASKESLAILELRSGLTQAWSRGKLPLTGHQDYVQIAMRLDAGKKAVSGDLLMFQSNRFWSLTGAAIQ